MAKKKAHSKGKPSTAPQRSEESSFAALRASTDFQEYMRLLKDFARKYCVMLVVKDTPVGPATTREMTAALLKLGLRTDLYGKYRCAYVALIDRGAPVFEKLEQNPMEAIDQHIFLGEDQIRLVSAGFQEGDRKGLIQINGTEYSPNMRGLNIVVYDKRRKRVLDTASFDMYAEEAPRFFPDADTQFLKAYKKEHPDVTVLCLRLPVFPDVPVTPGERSIRENKITFDRILQNLNQRISTLSDYFDEAGIAEVLSVPRSYFDANGIRRFEDVHGRYINISGGHRETAYQPSCIQKTIFLLGGCTVFGVGSDDSRTIASYLQLQCNRRIPRAGIAVQNYGYFLAGAEARSDESVKILNDLPAKSGDIIVYPILSSSKEAELPCIDLSRASLEPRDFEMFFDAGHYTPDGNRLISEKIFQSIYALGLSGLRPERPDTCLEAGTPTDGNPLVERLRNEHDFAAYLRLLKKFKKPYCILANAKDTPWGPGFTGALSSLFREIGFQTDLVGKFRCAYAAAIEDGELVYEELCSDLSQYIDVTLTSEAGDFQTRIISKGYNTLQADDQIYMEVNGTVYPSGFRGLNFIVYVNAGAIL